MDVQAILTAAADLRAYGAAIEAIELREAIRPIARRHVASLAAMVRTAPIASPPLRRARRDGLTIAAVVG